MPEAPRPAYRRVATLKSAEEFSDYLVQLGVSLGLDPQLIRGDDAPLHHPYQLDDFHIGNRFCVLPMEGWDGTSDGKPSDLTIRRWQRFGESGAKLIWGGEAVAVQHDGRANPHQLLSNDETVASLEHLRESLVLSHVRRFGSDAGLLVGLQL